MHNRGTMAHHKRPRDEEDEQLDRAIALSLAGDQPQSSGQHTDRQGTDNLSRGIALSLADAEARQWDCRRCTFTNAADLGRCAACSADRQAPFSSASKPVTEVRCGLAGCSQPRRYRDYCCEEHERRALAKRTAAPTDPGTDKIYFGASGDHAYHHLTRLDAGREPVKTRFLEHWAKDRADASQWIERPRVERIFRIVPSPQLREARESYAAAVGNRRERFHGTGARCCFGIDLNAQPCADDSCALCSIAAGGFRLAHSGTGPNAGVLNFGPANGLRYGRGLYFSATSGKSHDYAGGSERLRGGRRWRTMFMASVAAGNAFCTLEGQLDISRPPDGHDSVVGETRAKGGQLNYDELVVYSEQAALPQYLVVYSLAR